MAKCPGVLEYEHHWVGRSSRIALLIDSFLFSLASLASTVLPVVLQ